MNVLEVERGNYLFVANQDKKEPVAHVFKWVKGELRFLYFTRLVSSDYMIDQLHLIANKFIENKDQLDHVGYSENDILLEMQAKGDSA